MEYKSSRKNSKTVSSNPGLRYSHQSDDQALKGFRHYFYETGRGGGCEVLPLQVDSTRRGGGGGKSFSHAEGGRDTKSFGVVFTQYVEVFLAILNWRGGGAQKVSII